MPSKSSPTGDSKPRKIRRSHTGCKSCRRRGKKCDEAKPRCRACTRLSLDCSYGVDFSFQLVNKAQLHPHSVSKRTSPTSLTRPKSHFLSPKRVVAAQLPPAISSEADLEVNYMRHFHSHVRHILPSLSPNFSTNVLASDSLRCAILCISASNLSMLNAGVQSCFLPHSNRRSVFSPQVNKRHHNAAQRYYDDAVWHCLTASAEQTILEAPSYLATRVLLAYYHHASSDHLRFRLAVGEAVLFAVLNRSRLINSANGPDVLQMWYRLYQLYLHCIIGMSADDLIYDILIKTVEIRTKLVLFRCAARTYQVSEQSSEIGSLAHKVWNDLSGRQCEQDEYTEAREGFMQRSHLLGLLDVQKDRLKTFPTHRDAMNALYCLLCELIFEESRETHSTCPDPTVFMNSLAYTICQIASGLDFKASNTFDVYTFSLAEVLLQLVFSWQSDSTFQFILDILWPALESKGRGYEHSHYPTHMAKRTIAQLAESWTLGRAITLAKPAVAEDISKLKLLDINYPFDLAVCGYNRCDAI
ncbi:hypothetical protein N8T08_005785 [Aspergillus melleus]|uniref:Uncharacterized protein n=1 Tax=Aspergillus melleus TaxID=138277 RepID=A0ACC3B1A7_9EURO|nr:hypothetical protein N8T08_005785 [Aspergillus melleus]